MAKSVLIKNVVQAENIDALNRSFKYASADLDNGAVFGAGAISSAAGEGEVFTIAVPATGSLSGLWMAANPIDNIVTDAMGNEYKIDNKDPRNFTNKAGKVFSGIKPQVGDIITMTADGISGTADDYVVAANGATKLAFANEAGAGLTFKVLETTYITIASANAIGSQRVTAYKLECVNN